MNHADGREAIGVVAYLDIVEDVRAFLFQDTADFDGEHTDFGVGVRGSSCVAGLLLPRARVLPRRVTPVRSK